MVNLNKNEGAVFGYSNPPFYDGLWAKMMMVKEKGGDFMVYAKKMDKMKGYAGGDGIKRM